MNTGLWAATRGLLTPNELVAAARHAVERGWQERFAPMGEQPLLNVALALHGASYTSLRLAHPELATPAMFSGQYKWWLPREGRPSNVHWAGLALPSLLMPATNFYLRWRLAAPYRLRGLAETAARTMFRR